MPISYYKLKDEIYDEVTSYIDKRFDTEKSLILSYIGWGSRIAIAGLGVAIVTAGFFGWKSYDNIDSTITAEIIKRFDKDNPVKKYDTLLKQSAVGGVIASLSARIADPAKPRAFSDYDDSVTFLSNALLDEDVNLQTKTSILEFAKALPSVSSREVLARSARKLIKVDNTDTREQTVLALAQLIDLYSSVDAAKFATDILSIYDKYPSELNILRTVADSLIKSDNSQANRFVEKLAGMDDPVVKYAIFVENMKFQNDFKFDDTYVKGIVNTALSTLGNFSGGRDSTVSFEQIFDALENIDIKNKNYWPFVLAITSAFREKNYYLYYQIDVFSNYQTYNVILSTSGGSGWDFDLKEINDISRRVFRAFVNNTDAFAKATPADLAALDFWMLKVSPRNINRPPDVSTQSHIVYVLYDGANDLFDGQGNKIGDGRIGGRCAFIVEQQGPTEKISITWRDPSGALVNKKVDSIVGLDRTRVSLRGVPGLSALEDEL